MDKAFWLFLLIFGNLTAINFIRDAFGLKKISYLDPFYHIRDIVLFRNHETVYQKKGGEYK